MKYTYKCFGDNAGCLHLAVLDDSGACVYYLADQDRALIRETLDALRAGGDPIADGWEGGEPDPLLAMRGSSMLSTAATVERKRSSFNPPEQRPGKTPGRSTL